MLCAFDMIELDGKDLRPLSEEARGDPKAIKAAIEGVISDPSLAASISRPDAPRIGRSGLSATSCFD